MPPPAGAADTFLVVEHLAGNRRVPLAVFSALLAALPPVSPHTSPRLRRCVALRALDAALADSDRPGCADPSVFLARARAVLAHPHLAACLPDHLAACDDLVALKRLVDAEWASLPPSILESAAERIVGDGAPRTWASADQATRGKLGLLVGESTEREILGKLGQDPAANAPSTSAANGTGSARRDDEARLGSHVQAGCARRQQVPAERATDARLPEKPVTSTAIKVGKSTEHETLGKLGQDPSKDPQVDKVASAPSTSGANEANRAQQDDEAHFGRGNGKASNAQEDCARHQQEPAGRTTDAQLPEKPVTSTEINGKDKAPTSRATGEIATGSDKSPPVMRGSKPSLMERNPAARVLEWDDLDDSDPGMRPHKRRLPTYEMKPRPPPTFPHRTRKRWSEIEEKTLIEGVEKYGKGSWKDIKTAYPRVFADRSLVDLKDKFRNMEKHLP